MRKNSTWLIVAALTVLVVLLATDSFSFRCAAEGPDVPEALEDAGDELEDAVDELTGG